MVIGLLSAHVLEIAGEPCILNIIRDISARRHLEEQKLRSAQPAFIGQLAAGVAHAINNPINGVINYAQLLLNRPATGKPPEEILQLIIKEGNRVADLVKELLFFARDGRDQFALTSGESLRQSVLTLSRKGTSNGTASASKPRSNPACRRSTSFPRRSGRSRST